MLRFRERLPVYGFLTSRELTETILRLSKQEKSSVLSNTAILRLGRHVTIKVPSGEQVKAEREAKYKD